MIKPIERQIAYAISIAKDLNLKLPEGIHTSRDICKEFLDENIPIHNSFKSKKSGKEPGNKDITQKPVNKNENEAVSILGYWLDAVIRSSFQSLGSLQSELENCKSFSHDKIEHTLNNARCKELTNIYDKNTVRHLVLRLINKSHKSTSDNFHVIAVFPLKIIPVEISAQDQGRLPYKWTRCEDEALMFNPRLVGEYADIDGLNLNDIDALNNILENAIENDSIFPAEASLKDCLNLFDRCIDALTKENGGLAGYIERFELNKFNNYKLKNKIFDFVLVDGSAAGGATRQVRNCYEEIIINNRLNKDNLKLFRNFMMGFRDKRKTALSFERNSEIMNWKSLNNYLGHMDSSSDSAERECYALDNSQRYSVTLFKKN